MRTFNVTRHGGDRWDWRTPWWSCSPERAWSEATTINFPGDTDVRTRARYHRPTDTVLLVRDRVLITVLLAGDLANRHEREAVLMQVDRPESYPTRGVDYPQEPGRFVSSKSPVEPADHYVDGVPPCQARGCETAATPSTFYTWCERHVGGDVTASTPPTCRTATDGGDKKDGPVTPE